MKKISILALLFVVVFIVGACTKKKPVQTARVTEKVSVGEKSPFEIKGDIVQVNNQYCAASHSWMKKEDLGKWTNTVEYKGSNPKFKGKKLVFNQCCGMCLERFPPMWEKDQDGIMKFHGLE